MIDGMIKVPTPRNEPVLNYAPSSSERETLKAQLRAMLAQTIEIPIIIGGRDITTGKLATCVCPHDHKHILGTYHQAQAAHVDLAITTTEQIAKDWAAMPWTSRLSIFLKAADLLATKYRPILNAATMLGQSKSAYQAEIDAACELVDFFRFNAHFATQLMNEQPISSSGMWNYLDHRPLEGFVFAVTPFNFTSIAGNLPTAPAMMGNTVIWKPASTAVYSGYFIMQLLKEAGLPDGVINFVPGSGSMMGNQVLKHPRLAGIHFTGSTSVFQSMWKTVGEQIANYRSYPRIVGETGGKDFIIAHPSADCSALVTALVRGAFEYQGQKCSAASRAYLPASIYAKIEEPLVETIRALRMGDVLDFRNFMNAVIDESAFNDIKGYIDFAKNSSDAELLVGGECDRSSGYFIRPTLVKTGKPDFRLMQEEIFGPVLTLYVYPDGEYEKTLALCDQTSPYALTGAVFAQDRRAIDLAMTTLRHAAGNFYINDKPTGAVVGQQPFGGARASGTNDKAGSILNLIRWVSPRNIKENFIPPSNHTYPFMNAE